MNLTAKFGITKHCNLTGATHQLTGRPSDTPLARRETVRAGDERGATLEVYLSASTAAGTILLTGVPALRW